METYSPSFTMSKASGRTYEKANKKYGKQHDSDTNNTLLS